VDRADRERLRGPRPLGVMEWPRHPGAGAGEGIRTLDPNLGKVVLYP
jgi:hypothetical protein